jgi:hypothetical protein
MSKIPNLKALQGAKQIRDLHLRYPVPGAEGKCGGTLQFTVHVNAWLQRSMRGSSSGVRPAVAEKRLNVLE